MSWGKLNLVTQKDRKGLYDECRCSVCGFKKKYYGLNRDSECPKCHEKEKSQIINGVWALIEKKSVCQFCETEMVRCPIEGHPNSKFWALKRREDEQLMICPRGCYENGKGKDLNSVLRIKRKPRY